MAILLQTNSVPLQIISKQDSAIEPDEAAFEDYIQSKLDESKLTFKEGQEPTRFIMSRNLDYDDQQEIMSQQIKSEIKGGKIKQTANVGYMLEEVRRALIDIENPSTIPGEQHINWKRDTDGKTSKGLIALLNSAGIATELFSTRNEVLQPAKTEILKKS